MSQVSAILRSYALSVERIDLCYRHSSARDPYGKAHHQGPTIRIVTAPSAWRRSLARVATPNETRVSLRPEESEGWWRAWAHAPNLASWWWGCSVSLRAGRCGAFSLWSAAAAVAYRLALTVSLHDQPRLTTPSVVVRKKETLRPVATVTDKRSTTTHFY